ncbi:ATP-binding protein [Rhizosaccharibacter radicis]|uniref:histidine kinase n=1 Tax=Rhizosaccharibacter radicis TaxID=2782605 RepID=A0ABT1VZY4_9PROT|nr:PAS domain-containing sensor histidine kinase [Acetobacteraceae bacterium KSS12]
MRAVVLGRTGTLVLAAVALALGLASFVVLSGGMSLARRPHLEYTLFACNLCVLVLLATALGLRVARVMADRRRGLAGSRLHVRLMLLFSVVAVTPTIVVGIFAGLFFHFGIQIWFSDRVRSALDEALQASSGYLSEHNNNIRADALAIAGDLSQADTFRYADPRALGQMLVDEKNSRGLNEAAIYDALTNEIVLSTGMLGGLGVSVPPAAATMLARSGDVAILDSPDGQTVSAVTGIGGPNPSLMLVISRPVDPVILEHMHKTQRVVADYNRLAQHRSGLQLTLVMIFALVALLVLSAAALIGLLLANQIARPVGLLILAAERVREGDLGVRVPEAERDDEVSGLSRAFNRMTDELSSQRRELMEAYGQINERRRFTEAVLSGVSAGVIGLDEDQRIELPNRTASALLDTDLESMIGQPLLALVPEFEPLLLLAQRQPDKAQTGEVQRMAGGSKRTLLVRIGPEMRGTVTEGYVVTFDDITELQSAQRKAAWGDVARRIAHEIKNPLTPIQLSAERLKRRFLREIQSDPDTFSQCADTIVRHVGDIGRMVDEFSAFARMPQPLIKPEDLSRIAREALVLQRGAHPELRFTTEMPDRGPVVPCDRRLLGQALTNLLQNAADSINIRATGQQSPVAAMEDGQPAAHRGFIDVAIVQREDVVELRVSDDGVGLPVENRAQLTEPYVTHKPKGTGLGLAIVKKIMEDHGGTVMLGDRPGGEGAVATLILPLKVPHGA